MAGQQLSLINIINYFAGIASDDEKIKSFYYGPRWDADINPEIEYPIMIVIPEKSVLRKDSILLKHTIQVLDMVQPDESNRNQVLSDCLSSLLNIKAFIWKDFFYDIFPTDTSDLEPFYEKYADLLAGYSMDMELQLDWLADVCNTPGLYPSGVTFQTTGSFYSVNLANYLPLTGGILSGGLTGTTGYFINLSANTISATTMEAELILLSGQSLSDIFLSINAAISSATTIVQNGINTYTGGTTLFPSVNVVSNPIFTSVSASTYLNLPIDVYVTGGTYTTGTTVFTNNTGGTFAVSGYESTDTYVTGYTYSNNQFTIKQNNNQPNLSVQVNTVTGLTVNGLFSASTYQGLPTDIRVTGGTYSNGTSIFTNNTGGTFSVSGYSTGSTSSSNSITAFTYNNSNLFTIANSTGGTLSALANTFTAITATTSITTPIIYGGTGSASTLTLSSSSTSGYTGSNIIFSNGLNNIVPPKIRTVN